MTGECMLDVVARRVRLALEQRVRRHQEAAGTEATLRSVLAVERGLDGAESLGRAEPLDGRDLRAVDRGQRQQARAPRLAVDEHRAGAAAALLAARLRARDPELLAEHVQQRR